MALSYTYSIPTPPLSPEHFRMPNEKAGNSLDSTINLLDTLVAYYQQERVWVYRTRTILDDALPSQSAKDNLNENSYSDGRALSTGLQYGERYSVPGGKDKQPSRWMRRKKEFKLRIDGIRNINAQPAEATQGDDELPARKQILEMFDKMLESRLESCQRVDKLIREVNRQKVTV